METNETNDVTINDPKAVLDALARAKDDAKKYREQAEELETQLASKDEVISQYNNKLLNEKVTKKLAEEGIKDTSRFIKYLNISELSLDEDMNIIGFDAQLSSLKEDLPEVFDPKLRVGGQADAAVKATVSTQYSASEMQAMKILGKI